MAGEKNGPLGGALKEIISKIKKSGLTEEAVEKAWRSAAGAKAARHTRPVSLKSGRLTVNVDSSSWLYELSTKKKAITAKLAEKIKTKKIKYLRLRIGKIEKRKK